MKKMEKHKMIIELPVKVRGVLDKLAAKDNRKLKPYVENILIEHSVTGEHRNNVIEAIDRKRSKSNK